MGHRIGDYAIGYQGNDSEGKGKSKRILVTMRCPRCDSKVYPVEDSRFVWIQCGVCGKKSLAMEKEGMWGDETN